MFKDKLKNLKEVIKKEKLDAVFISSVSNIVYLTGYSNFSKDEREAYLFIGEDFGYIITDGRYSTAIKEQVPHLTLYERGNKNGIEELFKKHKISRLGIEEDNLTVLEHRIIKKHFKNIKHFSVDHLRSIKEKDEIEKIKKACEIGDKAFEYILKKLKLEVTEKEIAYELEKFVKEKKAEFSFSPIIAFGKNSSVPHHQTGDELLTINDQLILLDFGVKYENYCSDMTRTVFFGHPSDKQKEIYNVVLQAQQKAVDFINSQIKSGKKIKAHEVDKTARNYIIKQGYPDIPHSLGHGIGLEVHEHPYLSAKSKDELRIGMVFSIEPGIYLSAGRQGLPDFGSPRSTRLATKRARVEAGGVRIEDLYVLGKNGLEQLTNASIRPILPFS